MFANVGRIRSQYFITISSNNTHCIKWVLVRLSWLDTKLYNPTANICQWTINMCMHIIVSALKLEPRTFVYENIFKNLQNYNLRITTNTSWFMSNIVTQNLGIFIVGELYFSCQTYYLSWSPCRISNMSIWFSRLLLQKVRHNSNHTLLKRHVRVSVLKAVY